MKNKIRILPLLIVILLVKAELYAFYPDSSIFQANRLLAKTINIGYAIESGNSAGAGCDWICERSRGRQVKRLTMKEAAFE
jgi:hypothetical protein